MRWTRGFLAALVAGLMAQATAAPAAPPTPEYAQEIRQGKRPMPAHLRELKRKGPPKLRGERSAGKAIREREAKSQGGGVLWSLPAPGEGVAAPSGGSQPPQAPPVTGNVKALTLLVDFADVPASEADWYFDDLVYGDAAPSLSHYYREVSRNAFTILAVDPAHPADGWYPSDIGWLHLPGSKADYRGDLRSMLAHAVAASDGVVDFSDYDGDGDGAVDYLIVVHAGTGGEWSKNDADIWSQTLAVAPVETADNAAPGGKVRIDTFMTVPEYWERDGVREGMTIGVYAHEFGHLLGLPDLYDYGMESKGIGNWGLMGYGMWNRPLDRPKGYSPAWVSAWGRVALGWAVPQKPTADTAAVTFAPVEEGGEVYYLWNHGTANEEFFLLENRRKLPGSYDYYLPVNIAGLLVWHVDETKPDNSASIPVDTNRHNDCNWSSHYKVALQQADGWMELEMTPTGAYDDNFGDGADPYPGNRNATEFSLATTPNSGSYANCGSLVAVRNIVRSDVFITADLQVAAQDERPVATGASLALDEDTSAGLTLAGSDPDGDPLTFAVAAQPAHGVLTGDEPNLTYTPDKDFFGEDSFTFTVNDGYTDSAPATVTITVAGVPDPPSLATVGGKTVAEGSLLAFTLPGSDPDGDTLVYGATGLPAGASLDPATGAFAWTPGYGQAGVYEVVFTVDDGETPAPGDSETVTVTVTNTNRAPSLATVGGKTVAEGSPLAFTLLASDPDGDTLAYGATGLPAGASLGAVSGAFAWTPGYDQAGLWLVTFRAGDGSLSVEETVTIVVTGVNRPPQIGPVGGRQVVEGSQLSFTVAASDPDGDGVALAAAGLPAGAQFDPATGVFSWRPDLYAAGAWVVTFRATDAGTPALSAEEQVAITVLNPPGPVFSDGFTSAAASRRLWSVVSGKWAWSSGTLAATSLAAQNLARVVLLDPAALPLGAGVVRATLTLTANAGSAGPNGTIVFGYRGAAAHRWVRVTPAEISIGQTGKLDGIAAGTKRRAAVSQAVGKPATYTVKVWPSGLVQVFKGSATKPAVSHRFLTAARAPSVVRGGVGLGSLRARTLFDNVRVWEDSALAQ